MHALLLAAVLRAAPISCFLIDAPAIASQRQGKSEEHAAMQRKKD